MKNVNYQTLGPQISKYKDRQFSWADLFTLFLPGFFAFSVPGGYGIYLAYYAYTFYGKAAAIDWSLPWLSISAIAFLIFFILILCRIRISNRFIAIHQNGVLIAIKKKRQLPWDQISGISTEIIQRRFLFFKSHLTYKAIIHTTDREKIRLHEKIEHLPQFISRFKKIFYPIAKPMIEHNLFVGKNVNFGKVSIDRDYFILGNQKYPWSLMSQVTVISGRLVLELSDHTKIKIPTSKIQNIEVLLQLIKQGENIK